MARHEQAPHHREAQRLLAREVVTLVHGAAAAADAEKGGTAWSADLEPDVLRGLESSLPTTELAPERAAGAPGRPARPDRTGRLQECGHPAVRQGGAYANHQKIEDESRDIDADDFVEGRWLLLRAGKRQHHLVLRALPG